MSEPLSLNGCTAEPLMGYLKALGVLRLVCQQADADVRACWEGGVFKLYTNLDRDALTTFFRDYYRPTPLLAPWNGGSGFYVKLDVDRFLESRGAEIAFKSREAVDAIDAIESSDTDRLASYREQIRQTKAALGRIANRVDFVELLAEPLKQWSGATTRQAKKRVKDYVSKVLNAIMLFRSGDETYSIDKAEKDAFISDLRGKVLTDDGLLWLDAALAMRTGAKKNRMESPTLGSGGNIGNSDFSARFAQLLPEVMTFRTGDPPPSRSEAWLSSALFGTPTRDLERVSVDQFNPGKAGGANGTQGLEAAPILNPWDYLLMMEGALVLSGSTSRRFGAGRDGVSFPFIVASSRAGYGSIGVEQTRGEAWLPLWSAPASYSEIRALLSEGRAEVGRSRAESGLTFAQAIASLGVDRGIQSFVRYEFQERLGQSYIATPVGHFNVPKARVDGIELVQALNPLIEKLEKAADGAPARFSTAIRRIEAAVFAFCKYGGAARLAAILAALGNAERELAVGDIDPSKRPLHRPISALSSGWLSAASDGSAEFNLARGLAFLKPGQRGTGSIRGYLEPVEYDPRFRAWVWTQRTGRVVWGSRDMARNLGALLVRRLIDAENNGEPIVPLDSPFPVSLRDISAFLNREIDDGRFHDLLWGLSLIDVREGWELRSAMEEPRLPRAYAITKLTLLPGRLQWEVESEGKSLLRLKQAHSDDPLTGVLVKPELRILTNLQRGDVQQSCDAAARRLRAAGFVPIGGVNANGSRRQIEWSAEGVETERLLAALVFPVHASAVNQLAELVLRQPAVETLMERSMARV